MNSSFCDQSLLEDTSYVGNSQRDNASTSVLSNLSVLNNENISKKSTNVFRIIILSSLNKMTNLPNLAVWNSQASAMVVAQGPLKIQVSTNGFVLRRNSKPLICHCVLSDKGYFVIYAKETLCQGYALSLTRAKKLNILYERVEQKHDQGNKNNSAKINCTIVFKWKFGTVFISPEHNQVKLWCHNLISYFEGNILNDCKKQELNSSLNNYEVLNKPKSLPMPQLDHQISHEDLNNNVNTTLQLESRAQSIGKIENSIWTGNIDIVKTPKVKNRKVFKTCKNSVQRHCSDGALTFTPLCERYKKDQKLPMDWFTSISADDRFRRAKQYFETGAYTLAEENEIGSH